LLQEEVSRLQERCAVLLADVEEARASRQLAAVAARGGGAGGGSGGAGISRSEVLADRELMLNQIESVKQVRGGGARRQ
jgi:hypothetical protein